MITSSLPGRYAQALLDALDAPEAWEEASRALNELSACVVQIEELRNILNNPMLDLEGRGKILDGLFEMQQTPESVRRLLRTLLAGKRMPLLPDIAAYFERLVDDKFNRVEAVVTTAVPPTPELDAKLESAISRYTGKSIRMNNEVVPEILGGLIVSIRGRLFDFSLRSRLERLRARLLEEGALEHGN